MPPIESKSSKKRWADINAFHADVVKADPSWQGTKPEELLAAIQGNPDYMILSDQPPSAGFNLMRMADNFPKDFVEQSKQMGAGGLELLRNVNPNAIYDPKSIAGKIASSNIAPEQMWNTAKSGVSGALDEYKNFYFGGNFLRNLEEHPARVAADIATAALPIGRLAKIVGAPARIVSGINKVGTAADLISSPIPAISHAIPRMSMAGNAMARSGMDWALGLPKNTPQGMRNMLREYALRNGVSMTGKGQVKSGRLFDEAYKDMTDLEAGATTKGTLIEPGPIQKKASDKMKSVSPDDVTDVKYDQEVADLLASEKNFGVPGFPGQAYPITPTRAGEIRARFNKVNSPNSAVWQMTPDIASSPSKMMAVDNVNRFMKEQLAEKIPGHRKASTRAMLSKKLQQQAEAIQAASAGRSAIEHSNPYMIGSVGANALHGNMLAPVQFAAASKWLHTPQLVSRAAVSMFNPSMKQLIKDSRTMRSATAQASGNTVKAAGRKDPSRPFVEDDTQSDPSRPFKE